jgi:TetR/AcrR family transcriptional repressor of nem operon
LILNANLNALRDHGFQALRPDKEVQTLGITKGAYYHYFPGKQALGYALVDELIRPAYLKPWEEIYKANKGGLSEIITYLHHLAANKSDAEIAAGCLLNNLVQEMSGIDEGFASRLGGIVNQMHDLIKLILQRDRDKGLLKSEVKPGQLAWMIIAGMEGAAGVGRATRNRKSFVRAMSMQADTLRFYMNKAEGTING